MRSYFVREWGRLAHGDGLGCIPLEDAESLAAVASRSSLANSSGHGVLLHTRKGLEARGVVGIVAATNCQLEILPKIANPRTDDDGCEPDVRRLLVQMLEVAHDLEVEAGSQAQIGLQQDTLLEILIRQFRKDLTEAVRRGLPRRYLAHEDDLPMLRGRLQVTRQFTVLAASPQRLACRFDELSPDIPLNQVMKATVARLLRLAGAEDNRRGLRELLFIYDEVSEVVPSQLRWGDIPFDRTNVRWRSLLAWARLLLGNQYQDTAASKHAGYALLFDMNKLFESYIARLLQRVLPANFRVRLQRGNQHCLQDDVGKSLFLAKPDIRVERGGVHAFIVDTKWKKIKATIDSEKGDVAQGDVYQMMAYSQLYQCPETVLLYPWHSALPKPAGVLRSFWINGTGRQRRLWVASIDVSRTRRETSWQLERLVNNLNPGLVL